MANIDTTCCYCGHFDCVCNNDPREVAVLEDEQLRDELEDEGVLDLIDGDYPEGDGQPDDLTEFSDFEQADEYFTGGAMPMEDFGDFYGDD